jgi:hypothetical protein
MHHLRAGRLPDAEVVILSSGRFLRGVVQCRPHKTGYFIANGVLGYSAARAGRTSLAPGQRVERLRSYCGG